MMKKLNKPNMNTQVNIIKVLEQYCSTDADGFAKYKSGWNDSRVRASIENAYGIPVSHSAVRLRREAMFGLIRRGRPSRRIVPLVPDTNVSDSLGGIKRISDLEAQVAYLYRELGVDLSKIGAH